MTNILFKQHKSERLYPLGYKFIWKRGKGDAREYTVIDYEITHNCHGDIVRFEYVVQYKFVFGQVMTDKLIQVSMDRATNNGWQRLCEEGSHNWQRVNHSSPYSAGHALVNVVYKCRGCGEIEVIEKDVG